MSSFSPSQACTCLHDHFNFWNFLLPPVLKLPLFPAFSLPFLMSSVTSSASAACLANTEGFAWSSPLPTYEASSRVLSVSSQGSYTTLLWWLPDLHLSSSPILPCSRPVLPTTPWEFPLWWELQINMPAVRSSIFSLRCAPTLLLLIWWIISCLHSLKPEDWNTEYSRIVDYGIVEYSQPLSLLHTTD